MASPFMDVLEKMLDENEDDHDNMLSDDEQNMDEDQSGDAGECTDGGDQDYRRLVQSDVDFPDDDQSDQDGMMTIMMTIQPVKVRTCSLGLQMKTEFVLNHTSF